MKNFGRYLIGIAQIDDEIKEKINFRICPKSTINQMVSRTGMPGMRCFYITGSKNQHDGILQSLSTTEEIKISLTRLPSATYSLPPPSLQTPKLSSFLCFSQSSKFILSQIFT